MSLIAFNINVSDRNLYFINIGARQVTLLLREVRFRLQGKATIPEPGVVVLGPGGPRGCSRTHSQGFS